MKTRRCEPTLTDTQVLKFCRNGFLLLEGVVPDETNLTDNRIPGVGFPLRTQRYSQSGLVRRECDSQPTSSRRSSIVAW